MQTATQHKGLCLSGGAKDADLLWGEYAHRDGHDVIHWSFTGHKTRAPSQHLICLTEDELRMADPYCAQASHTLKRWFPPRSKYVGDLLRRNWYQVCCADSCYGISKFCTAGGSNLPATIRVPIDSMLDTQYGVGGGTAWAVQMFIDQHAGAPCACYVFDQLACYWFTWDSGWRRIYEPPPPQGIWTGIGTRYLSAIGRLAIRTVMEPNLV